MMTKPTFDQKIDNIQDQLDTMRREDASFRSYANRKFDDIIGEMVTKADLHELESRMATKADLHELESRMATKADLHELELRMVTKADLSKLVDVVGTMGKTITKIAEKVGVSP